MVKQAIRFGVGSADSPYIPVWRLWVNRDDAYLAQRDMGGTMKISMHERDWVSQFTAESGVKIRGISRRHTRWEPRKPNEHGWTVGATLVVPWVEWAREIPIRQDDTENVTWYPAPPVNETRFFAVVLSQNDQIPDTSGVVQEGDMYEDTPLILTSGRRVWLCSSTRPITADEQDHVEATEKEFRAFSSAGTPEEMRGAAGMEVYAALPIILTFPLGLRHFTFGSPS